MNWGNAAIGKINSVLHGLDADIRAGRSTITDPAFPDGDRGVRRFSLSRIGARSQTRSCVGGRADRPAAGGVDRLAVCAGCRGAPCERCAAVPVGGAVSAVRAVSVGVPRSPSTAAQLLGCRQGSRRAAQLLIASAWKRAISVTSWSTIIARISCTDFGIPSSSYAARHPTVGVPRGFSSPRGATPGEGSTPGLRASCTNRDRHLWVRSCSIVWRAVAPHSDSRAALAHRHKQRRAAWDRRDGASGSRS